MVAKFITKKEIHKGKAIIKEGEHGSEMYILNKGSVHVERNTLHNDSYRLVTLSADMHIFFGEQALMVPDRRSATVLAAEDCELYVIKMDDFKKLGDQHPRLGLSVTREIASKIVMDLRKANKDVITLFEALVGELENESD